MIVIGEKINTSIEQIGQAVENKDKSAIEEIAKKQVENGADYLDINCGTFIDDEPAYMKWLVETVQDVVDKPLCIDSPNADAVESGLKSIRHGTPIVNSITAERQRWEAMLPLVLEHNAYVVALCMDGDGIPEQPDGRVKIAVRLADELARKGLDAENIFFDPMVNPISTNTQNGLITLETMRRLKQEIPLARIVCGLSNISYGMPARRLINQVFMAASVVSGLDACIVDPLDRRLMSLLYASEALAGKDEYCMDYIGRYRSGLLD